jgi:hypothetical protein
MNQGENEQLYNQELALIKHGPKIQAKNIKKSCETLPLNHGGSLKGVAR